VTVLWNRATCFCVISPIKLLRQKRLYTSLVADMFADLNSVVMPDEESSDEDEDEDEDDESNGAAQEED
jgi:hypothetical protein